MMYDKMSWVKELRKNKDYLIEVSSDEVSWVGKNGSVYKSDFNGKCKEEKYGISYMLWNYLLVRKDGSFKLIDSLECDMKKELEKKMQKYNWENLKIIKSSGNWLIGLKRDGTVISIECYQKEKESIFFEGLKNWDTITDIACCSKLSPLGVYKANYVFGLKTNGTVSFATDNINYKEFGQSVKLWNNIVSIISIKECEILVGIRKDGTVVATGQNRYGQCDVELWEDIVDILIFYDCLIGVKKDGTLVKTGKINDVIWDSLRQWKDIAIIGTWLYYDSDLSQMIKSFYGVTKRGNLLVLYPNRNSKIETNHGFSTMEKMGNYFIDKLIRTKILKEEEFYYQTVVTGVKIF